MGIYANSDFGQAKPTEMTACRSVTEGSVPADFGKNHYEAFALGVTRTHKAEKTLKLRPLGVLAGCLVREDPVKDHPLKLPFGILV